MIIFAIHKSPDELNHLKEHASGGDEVYTLFDNNVFKIVPDAETAVHNKVPAQLEEIKMFQKYFAITDTQVHDILTQIINRLDETVSRIDNMEFYLTAVPVFKKIN